MLASAEWGDELGLDKLGEQGEEDGPVEAEDPRREAESPEKSIKSPESGWIEQLLC